MWNVECGMLDVECGIRSLVQSFQNLGYYFLALIP